MWILGHRVVSAAAPVAMLRHTSLLPLELHVLARFRTLPTRTPTLGVEAAFLPRRPHASERLLGKGISPQCSLGAIAGPQSGAAAPPDGQ